MANEHDRFYNDVSAGTWAVYGNGVEFEDANTQTVTNAEYSPEKPTDFGNAFSPDGKYWYGAMTSQIVEAATGDVIELPAGREREYAWTGPAELTFSRPFMVCSARSGQCQGPAGIVPNVCAPYGIACGDHLPVS